MVYRENQILQILVQKYMFWVSLKIFELCFFELSVTYYLLKYPIHPKQLYHIEESTYGA